MGIGVCVYIFFYSSEEKCQNMLYSSRIEMYLSTMERSERCHVNDVAVLCIHTICLALFR